MVERPIERKGGMFVNIQLHRLPVASQQYVWVWHISGELNEVKESDLLSFQELGWELFDPIDTSFPFLALISQLADTQAVLMGTNSVKTLVKRDSISFTEKAPVILAFSFPEKEQPPLFPTTPNHIGELGLIVEDDRIYTYSLDLLSEEGQMVCQQMRDALDRFLASNQPMSPDESGWHEAQHGARRLAELYWEVHQRSQSTIRDEVSPRIPTQLTIPPTKSSQTKFPPPTPTIIARNLPSMPVIADYMTQALLRALLDADTYTLQEEQMKAVHQPISIPPQGDIVITIQPGSGEAWSHVLASLNTLGDDLADIFCAVLALAIDHNGITDLNEPFLVDPDDLLKICQKKMSNRSYTSLQRVQVVEKLKTLARVRFTTSRPEDVDAKPIKPGKPRRNRKKKAVDLPETFLGVDIPVILLGSVIGEYKTVTGEALWEKREVLIGSWTKQATSLVPQTAYMLRQVLKYHSLNDRIAKRIGRYLTLQFRVNANVSRNGGAVVCTMLELLQQSGVSLKQSEHNPSRLRDNIKRALDRLRTDAVIGAYTIILDSDPEVRERIDQYAYGWWSLYTAQRVRIEPPAQSQEVFLSLAAPRK